MGWIFWMNEIKDVNLSILSTGVSRFRWIGWVNHYRPINSKKTMGRKNDPSYLAHPSVMSLPIIYAYITSKLIYLKYSKIFPRVNKHGDPRGFVDRRLDLFDRLLLFVWGEWNFWF